METGTQIANYLMYCGREYDAGTGNYFYRARYYNPQLGRFISRDPLSGAEFSQGTNLYAYCGNNFLNRFDPTGMSCQSATYHPLDPNDPLNQPLASIAIPGPVNPPLWPSGSVSSIAGSVEAGPVSLDFDLSSEELKLSLNSGGAGESGVSGALTLNETVSNGITPSGPSVTDSVTAGNGLGGTMSVTTSANGAQSTTVGVGLVAGASAGASTEVSSITFSNKPATPYEIYKEQQEMEKWPVPAP